jgi:hypothetical protein
METAISAMGKDQINQLQEALKRGKHPNQQKQARRLQGYNAAIGVHQERPIRRK